MTQPLASTPQTRSLTGRLLLVWALLAAILGHALLPVGSPTQRTTGSAFSASTVNVTTIPKQRSDASTEARNGDPFAKHFGDGTALPATFAWAPATVPVERTEVPWSGAAPLPDRLRTPHQPRAPPLA